MNYPEIDFSKFKKILVTGCQRSGTRIAAKMIAKDTQNLYLDETVFNTYHFGKAIEIYNGYEKFVMQCPALSAYVHLWPDFVDISDLLIVWMSRKVKDILASMRRINWEKMAQNEVYSYEHVFGKLEIKTSIPQMKNIFWNEIQQPRLEERNVKFINLWYDSLDGNPMWIPKEMRKDFDEKQTELPTLQQLRVTI